MRGSCAGTTEVGDGSGSNVVASSSSAGVRLERREVETTAPPTLPTIPGELLFISSPTARCGTTLLQRLLTSSPDTVVFGEGVAAGLVELLLALARKEKLLARAETHRIDLVRALGGEQFWYPHLSSEPDGLTRLAAEALTRYLRFHETEAARSGRLRWGAKLPTVPVETLTTLRRLVPGAKVLYVIRDLFAAARSAKSRRFWHTHAELEHMATTWRDAVIASESLRADPRVLIVDYEHLEQRGTSLLHELEQFTGCARLDPAVLFAKVNTFAGESEGRHPAQYLAPGELDEAELALLERTLRFALTGSVTPDGRELNPRSRAF